MIQINTVLRTYFTVIYFAVFAMISLFWHYADSELTHVKIYILAASAGYAVLYLLLSILITKIALIGLRPFNKQQKYRLRLVYFIAWFSSSLILLMIYGDFKLYELYEYHFNGFVWNLITTPGGIDALGATNATFITLFLEISAFLFTNALILWLVQRYLQTKNIISKPIFISFISLLITVLLLEESVYAYSLYKGKEDYLQAARVVPFHLKSSARGFLQNLGLEQTGRSNLKVAKGKVTYPLSPIESKQLAKYPNIIMLVAESFRWDLLDPEITPNLWNFASKSITFNQHYSGGNRTRMGLLSMFYGVYAPYWYGFQEQKIAPVLMDFLREKDYQLALHTSQSFDYPELRDTVFSGIPEKFMQELQSGEPWQRDTQNITDIISKLEDREQQKPFYSFMFFESTHAPYTFPEKAVIRPAYLKEMDYAKLNLMHNINAIHNRYINAAHHIDFEIGRLLTYLKQEQMLDNTIVLFTGDHGEEFMEKGHWGHGHNNSFPEEQVHVPLVLWMPGEESQQINDKTSHIQIPQTLLARLGVTTAPEEYSSAGDLFTPLPYLVTGNYNYLSIFDDKFKITFPFTATDYFHYSIYDSNDNSVERKDKESIIAALKPDIDTVLKESNRFINNSKRKIQ